MANELDELYEKGLAQMRKQLGPEVDKYLTAIAEIAPFYEKINVQFPYGAIYTRTEQLDTKTRELATLAALTVMGIGGAELKLHILAALRAKASKEEVIEVICQMVSYCGFPHVTQTLMAAKALFEEEAL